MELAIEFRSISRAARLQRLVVRAPGGGVFEEEPLERRVDRARPPIADLLAVQPDDGVAVRVAGEKKDLPRREEVGNGERALHDPRQLAARHEVLRSELHRATHRRPSQDAAEGRCPQDRVAVHDRHVEDARLQHVARAVDADAVRASPLLGGEHAQRVEQVVVRLELGERGRLERHHALRHSRLRDADRVRILQAWQTAKAENVEGGRAAGGSDAEVAGAGGQPEADVAAPPARRNARGAHNLSDPFPVRRLVPAKGERKPRRSRRGEKAVEVDLEAVHPTLRERAGVEDGVAAYDRVVVDRQRH
mmetsp:Transcript_23997/g.76032  ORF Transcript_23997/g.76032 Transcript_23997/m.76032 type:complete len:306 (-) Transcript_23997:279-1196(-)